jgi:hypothetical protein
MKIADHRKMRAEAKSWCNDVREVLSAKLPGETFAFDTAGDHRRQFGRLESVDGVYIVATLSARTNFFLYQKQPLLFVARVMLHLLREAAHWLNAG